VELHKINIEKEIKTKTDADSHKAACLARQQESEVNAKGKDQVQQSKQPFLLAAYFYSMIQ